MIKPITTINREGMRSITLYKVVDPNVTWKFKPKSHGSYKGRIIKGHAQIDLPLAEPESVNIQGIQTDMGKYDALPKDNVFKADPKTADKWFKDAIEPIYHPINTNPISSRLIDIAAEVEALENKCLKDYSTDELINEIKRRMK